MGDGVEDAPRSFLPIGPIRGVNPESNINLQNDQILFESKKDKCIELMRNSTAVHETLQKYKQDENLSRNFNLDLNFLIQVMFSDKHFLNSKLRESQIKNDTQRLFIKFFKF